MISNTSRAASSNCGVQSCRFFSVIGIRWLDRQPVIRLYGPRKFPVGHQPKIASHICGGFQKRRSSFMKRPVQLSSLLLMWTLSTLCIAQVNPYKDPTPGVTGYRAEVLAEVRVQEDKFSRLAE